MYMNVQTITVGIAFRQFLSALTKLFSAAEKVASAADHLGTWCDESAGAFADQAREDRLKRRIAIKELEASESKVTATA
jgi:hypothetical protein